MLLKLPNQQSGPGRTAPTTLLERVSNGKAQTGRSLIRTGNSTILASKEERDTIRNVGSTENHIKHHPARGGNEIH